MHTDVVAIRSLGFDWHTLKHYTCASLTRPSDGVYSDGWIVFSMFFTIQPQIMCIFGENLQIFNLFDLKIIFKEKNEYFSMQPVFPATKRKCNWSWRLVSSLKSTCKRSHWKPCVHMHPGGGVTALSMYAFLLYVKMFNSKQKQWFRHTFSGNPTIVLNES